MSEAKMTKADMADSRHRNLTRRAGLSAVLAIVVAGLMAVTVTPVFAQPNNRDEPDGDGRAIELEAPPGHRNGTVYDGGYFTDSIYLTSRQTKDLNEEVERTKDQDAAAAATAAALACTAVTGGNATAGIACGGLGIAHYGDFTDSLREAARYGGCLRIRFTPGDASETIPTAIVGFYNDGGKNCLG